MPGTVITPEMRDRFTELEAAVAAQLFDLGATIAEAIGYFAACGLTRQQFADALASLIVKL